MGATPTTSDDRQATVTLDDLLRDLSPQVLGALVRRFRDFAACEDATQDALVAASEQWPREGLPERPRAWLITVASRRVIDRLRSDDARRERERRDHLSGVASSDVPESSAADDTLDLLFLCCHPSLTPVSQMALTLRSVGGLSTAEVAAAFLVPEGTMTRRLTRARQRLGEVIEADDGFGELDPRERGLRLTVVLRVLYLVFNEGYATSTSQRLQRHDLTSEAIRLTRLVSRSLPDEPEVAGLLALMLLIDARAASRTGPDGALIPIAEQDRSCWDRAQIDDGVALLLSALRVGRVGPYQLQASIAGVHAEAPSAEATDWIEIRGLYDLLRRVDPSPVVVLNAVVAEAQANGVDAAFDLLASIADDPRLVGTHRVLVVRAHLLEMSGDTAAAAACFRDAARRTSSEPERRHLTDRAARLEAARLEAGRLDADQLA